MPYMRKLRDDARGGVAIIFSLALFVIIGCVGLAVDYGSIVSLKSKLAKAADAAALAAAQTANTASIGGSTDAAAQKKGSDAGLAYWDINILGMGLTKVSATITLTRKAAIWTSQIDYQVTYNPKFMVVLGFDKVDIAATAEAGVGTSGSFSEYYVLLDTSQSMGLAATSAGMNQLRANTGCQFGCHVPGQTATYDFAKSAGIPLRIDTLRSATSKLISKAQANSSNLEHFKVGLWTFDVTVKTLAALTSNLASVKSASTMIDLSTVEDGTQTDDALRTMNKLVTEAGDGTSDESPIKFLFLVTDGVQDGLFTNWQTPSDLPYGCSKERCRVTSPITPTVCEALKSKGIYVSVLYTVFVPFSEWQWQYLVEPFSKNIAPNLEACASPGFFFQATEAADIDASMQKMFDKALELVRQKALRLTK